MKVKTLWKKVFNKVKNKEPFVCTTLGTLIDTEDYLSHSIKDSNVGYYGFLNILNHAKKHNHVIAGKFENDNYTFYSVKRY